MTKVIKEGATKRRNRQKSKAGGVTGHVTKAVYDSGKSSPAVSSAMSTSAAIPRNAIVVIKNRVDIIDRTKIEKAAYYKAEKRNFSPGNEVQDWLEAEAEFDPLIK